MGLVVGQWWASGGPVVGRRGGRPLVGQVALGGSLSGYVTGPVAGLVTSPVAGVAVAW